MKYGPESDVQVEKCNTMFDANRPQLFYLAINKSIPLYHFDLSLIFFLTKGQDFEAPCHCLFGVGLSEIPGKSS